VVCFDTVVRLRAPAAMVATEARARRRRLQQAVVVIGAALLVREGVRCTSGAFSVARLDGYSEGVIAGSTLARTKRNDLLARHAEGRYEGPTAEEALETYSKSASASRQRSKDLAYASSSKTATLEVDRNRTEGQKPDGTIDMEFYPQNQLFKIGWFEEETLLDLRVAIQKGTGVLVENQELKLDDYELYPEDNDRLMVDVMDTAHEPKIPRPEREMRRPDRVKGKVEDMSKRPKEVIGYDLDPEDPNAPKDWARYVLTKAAFDEPESETYGNNLASPIIAAVLIIYLFFQVSEVVLTDQGLLPEKESQFNSTRREMMTNRYTDPDDLLYNPEAGRNSEAGTVVDQFKFR